MSGELSGGMNGSIKKPAPMVFSTADIVTAFCMLVCGFLYWNLINVVSFGLGVTLFTAVLCIIVTAYFRNAGLRQSKESLASLGIIILSAASFTLFDGILIKALNFIFLSLAFVYWVCLSAGARLENKISLYILSDMLHQLVVIPFSNFTGCFTGVKQVFVKNKKGKNVLGGVIGILFFLPVLILVVTLLSNADAAFEGLMDRIRFSISENVLEHIRNIILGLPVACYLYGLIYGNRYKRHVGSATVESVNEHVKAFRLVPDVTVYSALTALNLIYVVFFLAQTSYFFSAFGDSLPQSMTYAEYARRGFFELCAVSGINLLVIAVAHLIVKRDKIKILHADTDAMGVVYHTNYIKWFEVGRCELLRSMGYPYARMEAEGILLPVAECSCKYKLPAVYDDILEITARIAEVKGASITLEYEIRKQETGVLLVTGSTKHAITDSRFKPIRLCDKNRALYACFMK